MFFDIAYMVAFNAVMSTIKNILGAVVMRFATLSSTYHGNFFIFANSKQVADVYPCDGASFFRGCRGHDDAVF